MNKHILLSLLILSPAFVHAMENDSSFLSFFSWSSSNQEPNESKLITDLRKNINDFENQLQFDEWVKMKKTYIVPVTLQLFTHMNTNPVKFIQYCYYQKFHENEFTSLADLWNSASITQHQTTLIEGYSALGAAIIAKDISPSSKYNFIQELINHDFKPTVKDTELAELILYDEIAENHKTLLHLLHPHSEINWSVLPDEIRKQITQYMLQLFKNEFWLLPEKSVNDL